ncbi:helix-turn-helix domain-containing protein [Streptomyces sp. V4-01]|uniref:Helix-turn-helix domain-containing protein n=1 Tax=Actinacidiphila polyblastidii TaxID=3110430 RepID=A0ABU7PD04_9ACTN|nr:helix-turn-helix domain-containing protein [Streptomyces sp. V4-01]
MTEKQGRRSVADLLDRLFREVHPPGRGPYTYAEVAQGVHEATGFSITASAIQQLRTGRNENPKLATIRALAAFFGVPASYFFEEEVADRTMAEIDVVAAMRDADVRRVALRANGLSISSLKMVAAVIDQARRLEGIPDDDSGLLDDE